MARRCAQTGGASAYDDDISFKLSHVQDPLLNLIRHILSASKFICKAHANISAAAGGKGLKAAGRTGKIENTGRWRDMKYRTERDTMGEMRVPADKLWGAQTQRSLENFPIGTEKMPIGIIRAMALVKLAASRGNRQLGRLDAERGAAIESSCRDILDGRLEGNFPLSVWQTGSGTQTNMNVNEVIARRCREYTALPVHPNDHVNMSQSSNDTFPTAMRVAGAESIQNALLPAAAALEEELLRLEQTYPDIIKVGRTHLQDAVPIRFAQEISAWRAMLRRCVAALQAAMNNLETPQPAPKDPVPAVGSQTKLVKGSWLAIGNLAGMKAPETGRDYVDYVSDRLCFSQVMTCPIGEGKINSAYLRIKQADYYTVELGSTDCAAGTPVGTLTDYVNGTNSGSFAFWMRKVIDLINSVSTEAKVVLCTPRHSEEGTDLLPYARLIREIGEYEGYPVADLTANCGGQFYSDEISADEINQRVANEVTDGLNKVLKYDAAQ